MKFARVLASAIACLTLTCAAPAVADSYPSHPIMLVSPYSAGSGIDIMARLFASKLSPRLGQPVVVEAKPGAGSAIGSTFVEKAAPDGYTIMISSTALPVLPALYKSVHFDPGKDFTHITKIATGSMALVVNPKVLPVKSLDELVKIARAKPGKLTYGSAGIGTPHHLDMELLKRKLNLDIVHVPYRGATECLNDLLAGHTQLAMFPINVVLPQTKAGKLRVIAVSGRGRSVIAPEAKTFEELGLKDLDLDVYYFLSGPAKMPRPIVDRLNKEMATVLHDEDMRKRLLAMGLVVDTSTPEAITALIQKDTAKWKTFLPEMHIAPR